MTTIDRRTLISGSVAALAAPAIEAAPFAPVTFHRTEDARILTEIDAMQSALAHARATLIEADAADGMARYRLLFEMWCHLENARAVDRLRLGPAVDNQWDAALPHIPDRPPPWAAGSL